MSDSVGGKSLRNRAKVTEVPHEVTKGGLSEISDETSGNDQSATVVGEESFGAHPDNEIQYVNGYPIIRSGKSLHILSLSRSYS